MKHIPSRVFLPSGKKANRFTATEKHPPTEQNYYPVKKTNTEFVHKLLGSMRFILKVFLMLTKAAVI